MELTFEQVNDIKVSTRLNDKGELEAKVVILVTGEINEKSIANIVRIQRARPFRIVVEPTQMEFEAIGGRWVPHKEE